MWIYDILYIINLCQQSMKMNGETRAAKPASGANGRNWRGGLGCNLTGQIFAAQSGCGCGVELLTVSLREGCRGQRSVPADFKPSQLVGLSRLKGRDFPKHFGFGGLVHICKEIHKKKRCVGLLAVRDSRNQPPGTHAGTHTHMPRVKHLHEVHHGSEDAMVKAIRLDSSL